MGDKGSHFHIRWSEKGLDWERFSTQAEAEKIAKQLASPEETFTIEQHGNACPQCLKLMRRSPDPSDSSDDASA